MNRRQFLRALGTMATAAAAAPYLPAAFAPVSAAPALPGLTLHGAPLAIDFGMRDPEVLWFISRAAIDRYNALIGPDRRYRIEVIETPSLTNTPRRA